MIWSKRTSGDGCPQESMSPTITGLSLQSGAPIWTVWPWWCRGPYGPTNPAFMRDILSVNSNCPVMLNTATEYGWRGRNSSSWIWKGVSATLQSGRYTPSYPRGRIIVLLDVKGSATSLSYPKGRYIVCDMLSTDIRIKASATPQRMVPIVQDVDNRR